MVLPAVINCANLCMARSGRWRAPYTVKNRRHTQRMPYKCEYVWHSSSPEAFVAAYGEIGFRIESSSLNGTFAFAPYTEEEEPNTNWLTLWPRASSSKLSVPLMFVSE